MDVQYREQDASEHSYIVGRQPFQNYLRFIRGKRAGDTPLDEKLLAQEWREIQRAALAAEEKEAGFADDPQLLPLPDEMIPIAQEARRHEILENALGARNCQWWLVEIDRAIVFQPWVDLKFTRHLEAMIPRPVRHEDHIRVAAGTFVTKPKVTAMQPADDKYLFLSPSTDVRFLGATILDPASIQDAVRPRGFATHVVTIFLGSSINCLSALYVDKRLILLNGTHRAFTLRSLGFTHVACLVTHVTTEEEKAQLLPPAIKQDEPRFLTSRRPPLFKDYFDPTVRRIIPTIPTQTLLKLHLEQSKEIVPSG